MTERHGDEVTQSMHVLERADTAMHDVAQLHLHEYAERAE